MILDGECECEEFALRILQENRLEGLMPVSARRLDGSRKYCFEISRGKSLARILEKRSITIREIRQILFAIDQVIGRMEEYLLDPDHLILEPELIYGVPDISHMLFCCHPAVKRSFFDQIRELIQYFLNKTDHLEERSVETAYALFRVCQQEYFRFDDLLSVVGREEKEMRRIGEEAKPDREENREEEPRDFWTEQEEPEETERTRLPILPVFAGAAGVLLLIFSLLRQVNGRVFEVKWILGGGLLLLLAGLLVFLERKKTGKKVQEPAGPEDFPQEPSHPAEYAARTEEPVCAGSVGERIHLEAYGERESVPQDGGTTEVLSGSFRLLTRERVLISENSLRYETIHMKKMPFVIGKLSGVSDFTLKRSTVSRIHARLEQQGNEIFLTDCNSTNGTFLNGIRLEPNRCYPLQEGDEVGFADLKYIFQ